MSGEPAFEQLVADGYRAQLARMHERIRVRGPFVSHAQRFLIEARKPR
ncbi:MAG TPA: hypothetical protein VLW44_05525 [Streptosporangiaceae bacterium]|nr:hypothetical protein [Streptosporangiaceae bacterium]